MLVLQPAPLLVPIIEEGRPPSDPLVKLALQQYLRGLVRHRMEVLVLGCTHYPVYKDLIQKMVGRAVTVIDSAQQCAEDVARQLRAGGLIENQPSDQSGTLGSFRCYVTDDPSRFRLLAPRFLGVAIDEPLWVAPDELYEKNSSMTSVPLSIPA
jgi:glutamate racemase